MEAFERTKDEEAKKFQTHSINFDLNIIIRIKESMVDVSSSCMELALQVVQAITLLLKKSIYEQPKDHFSGVIDYCC